MNNTIYTESMKIKRLIIIGAGGHGKVVYDIAKENGYQIIKFLDDSKVVPKSYPYEIIGCTQKIKELVNEKSNVYADWEFVVAIGDCIARKKYIEILDYNKAIQPVLIHPSAVVSGSVHVGYSTVIMPNVVINSNSTIGKGCIINSSASVDHDCIISDYTHIAPGVHICGNVQIGDESWIGVGCNIINKIIIGNNVFVGAGTTVIRNIVVPGKYVGLPIRRIENE